MKDYLHKHIVDIPLYRGKLVLVFSNSCNKIAEEFPFFATNRKEEQGENWELYAHSFYGGLDDREAYTAVFNFHSNLRPITPGSIAHEALHIANMIFYMRGVQPDFTNDEPLNYLLDWIVDTVYKVMDKMNDKYHLELTTQLDYE